MKAALDALSAETVSFAVVDVSFSQLVMGGVEGWLRLCDDVHRLVDSNVDSYGGIQIKDRIGRYEFVYAFARASSAIEAMIEIQKAVLKQAVDGFTPALRAAVLTGEVSGEGTLKTESALEEAVGLKDLAHVHQILISLSTRELARLQVGDDVNFKDLGLHRSEVSQTPQRVFQVVADGIPSEFPPIRSMEEPFTNIGHSHNVLVGREKEMFEIAARLRDFKVLTVTGASGVGKSRIVEQIARILLHDYPDGAFRIDLGELTESSFIAESIASELPFIDASGGELVNLLRDQLHGRQLLLILDNCDNLPQAIAQQVNFLFGDIKGAEVLITCREPLGFTNEALFHLQPLDNAHHDGYADSCTLLLQRVREIMPGFVVAPSDQSVFTEICKILRGMPLAIELVASKFRVLKATEILAQIKYLSDGSLSTRSRDLQKLVDRVLEWIYQSLPLAEKKVFRRLAVFSDGWDPAAAELICADPDLLPEQIKHAQTLLVQKGLVRRQRLGVHQHRDSLYQALWQFAHRCLQEAGELTTVKNLHLKWMLGLAAQTDAEIRGPKQSQLITQLNRERHNIRLAIEWTLDAGKNVEAAHKLIRGFQMFWYKRGYFTEGKIWLERLLSSTPYEVSEPRAKCLSILGVFLTACGDEESAVPYFEHALDLATKIRNEDLRATVSGNLGICYRGLGRLDSAVAAFQNTISYFQQTRKDGMLATALSNLGGLFIELKRYDEARATLVEALQLNLQLGNEWAVIMVRFNIAQLELEQDSFEAAEPLLNSALTNWYGQQDLRGVAMSLKSLAVLSNRLGQDDRAAVLLGAASSVRSQIHQTLSRIEVPAHEALVQKLTKSLGEAPFFRKWGEGSGLSAEAAVAYAIGSSSVVEAT
ncbi:MAG TPA: tetratricopeptide repeat protein [Fimbriimonadaceae bacterium]